MRTPANKLRGFTCVSVTPDGCALLVPDAFAFTNDVTNIAPDSASPGIPPLKLPDFSAAKRVQSVPVSDPTKVCKRCGATQSLSTFMRTYTARQAINMGYAKPNPAYGLEEGQPQFLHVPRVQYESAVCKSCQPQSPFYPRTPRGMAFAQRVGLISSNPEVSQMVLEARLMKHREQVTKHRLRNNFMRLCKRRLLAHLYKAFTRELDSIKQRRSYIMARQQLHGYIPLNEWLEFLDDYIDALMWLRVNKLRDAPEPGADPQVNIPPYQRISKKMFTIAKGHGAVGWAEDEHPELLVLWVDAVCERARLDALNKPLGDRNPTLIHSFVDQIKRALRAWDRLMSKSHREKQRPHLLELFHQRLNNDTVPDAQTKRIWDEE